ncbi:hypothetical protein L0U85_20080, partial [Glycomyces sp. L485]|nr:hypothetical protein [Glycomyces sp. L485]
DQFVREFTQTTVIVRSPSADTFVSALEADGASVTKGDDGELVVSEMEIGRVGHLAFAEGIELTELSSRSASLEEAFISATGAAEQFVAENPNQTAQTPGGAQNA